MKNLYKNLIILLLLLSSILFSGCGSSSGPDVTDHLSSKTESNSVDKNLPTFEFKSPLLLDVVRGELPDQILNRLDDEIDIPHQFRSPMFHHDRDSWKNIIRGIASEPLPPPVAFNIEETQEFRYPADGLAYKEIQSPVEPLFKLILRKRKLNFHVSFNSNWNGVNNPSNYSLQVSFKSAAKTNISLEEKIKDHDFQITQYKDQFYALFLSLNENEICGNIAKTGFEYRPRWPGTYSPLDSRYGLRPECHPGENLVGSISIIYNKDQDGNDIQDESQKKKLTLQFVE